MEKKTVQAHLSINADEAISALKCVEEVVNKINDSIQSSANELKVLREMSDLTREKIPGSNNREGYDVDAIIKRISSQLAEGIASTPRKPMIFDDPKINAYDTDIIVEELVNVLKSKGLTIGEAERILDKAKAELSYVRLVSDRQTTFE